MKKIFLIVVIFLLSISNTHAYLVDVDCETVKNMNNLTGVIKKGSSGANVGLFNRFLVIQGFLTDSGIQRDQYETGRYIRDYFGNNTRIAVIKFQKKYGITPTGQIGKISKQKIQDILCNKKQ